MSCDRTEYRLLLHAHEELGMWERWLVNRHLRGCPGCRELRERFRSERGAIAGSLTSAGMGVARSTRVADRIALEIGVPRPATGPRMVVSRRVPILFILLVSVLSAGSALAYVQWRYAAHGFLGLTARSWLGDDSDGVCPPVALPSTVCPPGEKPCGHRGEEQHPGCPDCAASSATVPATH